MAPKIAITGSTGMIGSTVSDWFTANGSSVTRLVRPQTKGTVVGNLVTWDPESKTIDAEKLEGHDAVIHFGGVSISGHRWNDDFKEKIFDSRINSTRFLADTLSKLRQKPKVFLSTSAIGYYGPHSFDVWVDESFISANTFLGETCREWELATRKAEDAGIRVIHMRMGIVLSNKGGAMSKLLPVFQKGLGGKVGSGKQMMSWIALAEIPLIIDHLVKNESVSGPVNFVASKAVSNSEFTRILAEKLNRPAMLPLPAFMVKVMFGEMGEELLLSGARIVPKKLQQSNYAFKYPDLFLALNSFL